MMRFRFIDKLDIISAEKHSNQFDTSPYIGLQVRVNAQKAAVAILESMIGRVRVNYNGTDIINCLWSNLRKWQDLYWGKPEVNEAAAGSESNFGIFIPFCHVELPSAIHKEVGDDLNFYIEKFGESGCAKAEVEIYGVEMDLPQLYVPRLYDTVKTAAAGEKKLIIEADNITSIMLTKPATTVQTLIQLLIDNKVLFSGNWNNLVNLSNNFARIEATALEVILFDLIQKKLISEALCDGAVILSTGGVGDFYVMLQSLMFDADRTERTGIRVQEREDATIREKANKEGAILAAIQVPNLVRRSTFEQIQKNVQNPAVKRQIEEIKTRIAASD